MTEEDSVGLLVAVCVTEEDEGSVLVDSVLVDSVLVDSVLVSICVSVCM